jgi:hypothetical protein
MNLIRRRIKLIQLLLLMFNYFNDLIRSGTWGAEGGELGRCFESNLNLIQINFEFNFDFN